MRIGAARALLAIGMWLAACAATPAGQPGPVVQASAEGDGNSVEVALTGRDLALDVWSNRGIGAATVTFAAGPAPAAVELRLHLRALEELRLTYGQAVIVAAVASGPGHAVTQRRVAPDGSEQALDPASPGWLTIRVVAAEPDPPFPLRDGHIAITLPPDLIAGGAGTFSIQWVDFFR